MAFFDGEMAFFNGNSFSFFLKLFWSQLLEAVSRDRLQRLFKKTVLKAVSKGRFHRLLLYANPFPKAKILWTFIELYQKIPRPVFCMCSNSINLLRWLIFNRFIGSSYSAQICFCRQAECFFLSVCFCRILWYQLKVFFVLLSHFKPALNYVVCKMFLLWFFLRSVRSSSVSVLIFCLFIYVFASAGDSNTL